MKMDKASLLFSSLSIERAIKFFRSFHLVLTAFVILFTTGIHSGFSQEQPNSRIDPSYTTYNTETGNSGVSRKGNSGLILVTEAVANRAIDVGYYDMSLQQGLFTQAASITNAGHNPVNMLELSAGNLLGIEVLLVQNPSNFAYGSEYLNHLADIEAAVRSGMVLIIHDRFLTDASTILPGGADLSIIRKDIINEKNIDILDNTTTVTNGPGGTLNHTSLDNGNSSSHGFATAGTFPNSAKLILSRTDSTEIVTFAYPFGNGWVIYSTIPLDFYLAGSGNNPTRDNMSLVYAPNIIAFGAELYDRSLVLLAEERIDINQHQSIKGHIHSNGDITYGNGLIDVFSSVHQGNATAVKNIDIAIDNQITGKVLAADTLTIATGTTVGGAASGNVSVTPIPLPALTFTCNDTAGSLFIHTEGFVAPGNYNVLRAVENATLHLSSGEYLVNILKIDPAAILNIDINNGPVTINVCSVLKLRKESQINIIGGTSRELTINYLGTEKVELGKDGSFQGHIIAPHARVKLSDGASFTGSICAKIIDINKDVWVRHHDVADSVLTNSLLVKDATKIANNIMAKNFTLDQNFPNPFNPNTRISYTLSQAATVTMQIYGTNGQRIKTLVNRNMPAGQHNIVWDGRNSVNQVVASGAYIYRIAINNNNGTAPVVMTKKMLFLK